jgi:hypothetical protein
MPFNVKLDITGISGLEYRPVEKWGHSGEMGQTPLLSGYAVDMQNDHPNFAKFTGVGSRRIAMLAPPTLRPIAAS